MTNIETRVAALERMEAEAGPLVVFGEPTPMQSQAIEQAHRDGRTVIHWPVAPPRIDFDLAERKQI